MTATKLAVAKSANAVLDPLPWWRSPVLWGLIFAILGPLAQQLGIISNWDDAAANATADLIANGVTAAGAALALYGRLTQKAAPPISAI